jgi:hypothetical protein
VLLGIHLVVAAQPPVQDAFRGPPLPLRLGEPRPVLWVPLNMTMPEVRFRVHRAPECADEVICRCVATNQSGVSFRLMGKMLTSQSLVGARLHLKLVPSRHKGPQLMHVLCILVAARTLFGLVTLDDR